MIENGFLLLTNNWNALDSMFALFRVAKFCRPLKNWQKNSAMKSLYKSQLFHSLHKNYINKSNPFRTGILKSKLVKKVWLSNDIQTRITDKKKRSRKRFNDFPFLILVQSKRNGYFISHKILTCKYLDVLTVNFFQHLWKSGWSDQLKK